MGAAAAVLPIIEHNPSIFKSWEDSWCSECVLSPPRVFDSLFGGDNASAVEDREQFEGSPSLAANTEEVFGFSGRSGMDSDGVGPSDDLAGVGGSGRRWCHSVDEAELRAIFRTFDENDDGLICKKELRRFTNVLGFEMSDADAESMIASAAAGSGRSGHEKCKIDFTAFCRLYRTHLVGEGCSVEEEVERVKEENDNVVEAFKVFDKNGDGRISAEELKAVLHGLGMPEGRSLKQCTKMIQNVDCDGDGQCDINEFKKMMASRIQ